MTPTVPRRAARDVVTCPSCGGKVIQRSAGAWCARCRGWIVRIDVWRGGEDPSGSRPVVWTG